LNKQIALEEKARKKAGKIVHPNQMAFYLSPMEAAEYDAANTAVITGSIDLIGGGGAAKLPKKGKQIVKKSKDWEAQIKKMYQKYVAPELENVKIPGRQDIQGLVTPGKIQNLNKVEKMIQSPYRSFEKIFKDNWAKAERVLIRPFDKSKFNYASELQQRSDELGVVANTLKLKKGSKADKAIVQLGEKKITSAQLVEQFGPEKAKKLESAERWFRSQYDNFIKEANDAVETIYKGDPKKIAEATVHPRADYFRHGQELNSMSGLKSILDTPADVPTSQLKTWKWLKTNVKKVGFQKERKTDMNDLGAMEGYIDYVKNLSYLKHINPTIPKFRQLANEIRALDNAADYENTATFLEKFADKLDGQPSSARRWISENIPGGDRGFKVLQFFNNRAKTNAVLGNASTALAQSANVTQMVADAGGYSVPGVMSTMKGFLTKSDPASNSKWLKERYIGSAFDKFDKKMMDQPRKLANWMIHVLDESTAKFAVNSQYYKNLAKGMPEEEALYEAGVSARKLIGGRGVGERSLAQSGMVGEIVAPFTLEMTNAWLVMKDWVDEKTFGKLAAFFVLNHGFNKAVESTGRSSVVFDPIDALIEGFTRAGEREGVMDKAAGFGGPVIGEIASNLPGAGLVAQAVIPDAEEREEAFGTRDPAKFSRYGSPVMGLEVLKDVAAAPFSEESREDLLYSVGTPFGGKQLEKTVKLGQSMQSGEVEPTPSNIGKGIIGGKFATEELESVFGDDNSVARIKLNELQRKQDKATKKKYDDAEKFLIDMNDLSDKEFHAKGNQLKKDDPELYAAVKKVSEQRAKNYTDIDREVAQLWVNNEARAEYYFEILKEMTYTERIEYIKDQQDKKLFSKNVEEQVSKMKDGKSFDEL